MASLSFRNVVKQYHQGKQSLQVIHGVNAEVADGEFVVIVGPSGCGKSTLLRMVAGLEEVTGGDICIGDRVVNQLEPAARDIAMVFQNYALYPHMSVFENMAYGLKIQKLPKDEIRARVDKAASILELSHLLERKPRQLSGGQRQRVAMGRAIVRQPQVLLFVTHDQVEAMTLAQRMIVMNGGHMEQFGTPEEVYARPATTFVASFIGSPPMNLLKDAPGGRPGSLLGIRPEHLDIADDGWLVQVETVELLGAERLIHTRLGDESLIIRLHEDQGAPDVGSTISVKPRADRLHWFDAETGRRQ